MNKKCIYIVGTAILLLMGLISAPATVSAGGKENCSYIGSWYGYSGGYGNGPIEWIINVQGQSQSSGTNDLEDPVFDVTLGGAFEDAVKVTSLKGVWERTGSNTFSLTMIGYTIDAVGTPVWIGKMSGNVTLVDECNREDLDLTLEVFSPEQDPFAEAPMYGGFPLPIHEGYRMRVDPPYPH